MEKYHKQDVAPIEKENERDENYEAANPQIDSERTKNNYRFTPYFGKTYKEFINGRIKELGLSPRKDAVVMNSFVLGSDKTFFDGLSRVEQYNFFSDCYKFFAERYGEENIIAAVVHNDESTPHMHLNLMPVTKDGRLCSKQLFDKPQLQQLQTNFYETVGKRWGLQRGKEGSQKKHLSTAEYKTKKNNRASGSHTGRKSGLCGRFNRGKKREYSEKTRKVTRASNCFNGRQCRPFKAAYEIYGRSIIICKKIGSVAKGKGEQFPLYKRRQRTCKNKSDGISAYSPRKAENNRQLFRFRSFSIHARRRSASSAIATDRSGNRRRTQKTRKTK